MFLHNGARPCTVQAPLSRVPTYLSAWPNASAHSLTSRVCTFESWHGHTVSNFTWHAELAHIHCRSTAHMPSSNLQQCHLHLVVFERTLARPLQQLLHQLGQHRWQTPQSSPPALQRHALLRQPLPNASCIVAIVPSISQCSTFAVVCAPL